MAKRKPRTKVGKNAKRDREIDRKLEKETGTKKESGGKGAKEHKKATKKGGYLNR